MRRWLKLYPSDIPTHFVSNVAEIDVIVKNIKPVKMIIETKIQRSNVIDS